MELTEHEQSMLNAALDSENSNTPETIKVNPPLPEDNTTRFKALSWVELMHNQKIMLAGLGGIGSNLVILLGRLNPAWITIFDNDKIEEVNIAGQLYSMNDLGQYKSYICGQLLTRYSKCFSYDAITRAYTIEERTAPVMICGFDNMAARRIYFNNWLKDNKGNKEAFFQDGRLLAEEYQIISFSGDDEKSIKRYKDKFLFSDDKVEPVPCTSKQTSFMAQRIAADMCNIFVNFVDNLAHPDSPLPREVPFFVSYNGGLMFEKFEA